jgi:hypothetical protein
MNTGKGITWLAFVIVLNLVSPRDATGFDRMREWAGLGSPTKEHSATLRSARSDFVPASLATPASCKSTGRCVAGAKVEGRTSAAERQWLGAR